MTSGPNQINGLNYYERLRLKFEIYFIEERAKIDCHFGQPIIIDEDEEEEGNKNKSIMIIFTCAEKKGR